MLYILYMLSKPNESWQRLVIKATCDFLWRPRGEWATNPSPGGDGGDDDGGYDDGGGDDSGDDDGVDVGGGGGGDVGSVGGGFGDVGGVGNGGGGGDWKGNLVKAAHKMEHSSSELRLAWKLYFENHD